MNGREWGDNLLIGFLGAIGFLLVLAIAVMARERQSETLDLALSNLASLVIGALAGMAKAGADAQKARQPDGDAEH